MTARAISGCLMTRPSETRVILDVYLAEPDTAAGVDAVIAKFGLSHFRALHEINKALNAANAGLDFSKYREALRT